MDKKGTLKNIEKIFVVFGRVCYTCLLSMVFEFQSSISIT